MENLQFLAFIPVGIVLYYVILDFIKLYKDIQKNS